MVGLVGDSVPVFFWVFSFGGCSRPPSHSFVHHRAPRASRHFPLDSQTACFTHSRNMILKFFKFLLIRKITQSTKYILHQFDQLFHPTALYRGLARRLGGG